MESPELKDVKKVWKGLHGKSPIYDFLLGSTQDLTFISASKGSFKARLKLRAEHVNSRNTLHGSVIATIVDWAGGLAIATHGLEKTGVSVDIHVTYLSTAQVDETIEIEGNAHKVGRTLGFTSVKLTKVVHGELGHVVATGSHTKYIRQ
jgi:acyl-coenzyme A thioesterase 13